MRSSGRRVWVRTVQPDDVPAYRAAVQQSAARISVWNPVNPDDIGWHLDRQSEEHRTFLIHATDPEGSHGIVGKVNVTNVVRGRFQSGVLGYDSYDPYVGRGLFAEGMRQIINLAFRPQPEGMGLHRLEANVRPGNSPSAGLLRSLGFRREGLVRDMLWLPGADRPAWRDHVMHAMTREEWPASAYSPHRGPRMVLLVNGIPGSGKSTLAPRLAAELGLPLFAKDMVKETLFDNASQEVRPVLAGTSGRGSPLGAGASELLWQLLAASPVGGVVENIWWADDQPYAVDGLQRAGFDPAIVPHVWCSLPLPTARRRHEERVAAGRRHPVHGTDFTTQLTLDWDWIARNGKAFDFGVRIDVDTSHPVDARTVTHAALRAQESFAR
ncbi:GNAT family N-acetyltransferase [Flexivirga caeni]|uniref:GNAT family N-acetyltransferase n=1 Tax=Flexivirga caeni TaxID=2294115 RepID=UPI0013152FD4|nr:GNAT family N-acetyltransferase [Flexivirga caeni]